MSGHGRDRRRSSVVPAKDATRRKIERMEAEREARREAMKNRQRERASEHERNIQAGNPGDVDFIGMVRDWRKEHHSAAQTHRNHDHRICVAVRKRPIDDRERQKLDHDSVTCYNPQVWIHSSKTRVDGITKYLDQNSFKFDHSFDESTSTQTVYDFTTRPLLEFALRGEGGRSTVFAYGQTGSGKTFTMNGIQECLCRDLYYLLDTNKSGCNRDNCTVAVSFFEMYGGYVQDLLNDRNRLKILEDGKGEIVVNGLSQREAHSPNEFVDIVHTGQELRTTHTTEANDTSSRSHAICQILLEDSTNGKLLGKISLVDLAGSERGTDTKSHNSQRRAESADINTSLLSLKECVRALDSKATHVPYRSSKLTLLLKDCFTFKHSKTSMIATVSPGASSTDHSLNTLRYADRIKSQRSSNSPYVSPAPIHPTGGQKERSGKSPLAAGSSASDTLRKDKAGGEREREAKAATITKRVTRSSARAMAASATATPDSTDLDDALGTSDEKDQAELRATVQSLLAQEEEILSVHMKNIQENAELLTEEGELLQDVQRHGVSDQDIEEYVQALESVLDCKETMILDLQEKLLLFTECLEKEQMLSKKVSLSQY